MLVSWILNTISPEVKTTLSKFDDAKLLWDDLKERFSIVDGPKIHQVKSDIAHCEQSKTQTVAIYYGKLKVLWDELNNYEPLIACSCGKCTCKINSLHEQRRESERLHQFLMGLSADFYGQIRSQLLSQTPLPTLNRVFQQISQEERVRGIMQNKNKDDHSEILGFAVHGGRPKPDHKIDKTNLLCTHCKSRGHELSSCFEIIGYPEWWGPRPRISHATAKKPARETGSNFSPLQLGMRPDYRSSTGNQGNQSLLHHPSGPPRQMGRPNGSTRAHVVSAAGDSGFDTLAAGSTSANSLPMEPMHGPLPGFSHDQWQSLFAAFGPSLEESDWAG
ncbi:unnamed protein product [Cuscuta epithymum]|uniref:Retrotransposon gag domain-containing protein n=1 Tax=Cuscuta epithymum TaxID=186058 RepID=A0AAV0D7U1_9ASTE|nr:unnamed protein product [Cuscuta epithymum]